MFAAMTEPILAREAPFFRLGSENLADLALLLDDHIAALGHAEGFLQQPDFVLGGCLNGSNHDGCTKFDIWIPSTRKVSSSTGSHIS